MFSPMNRMYLGHTTIVFPSIWETRHLDTSKRNLQLGVCCTFFTPQSRGINPRNFSPFLVSGYWWNLPFQKNNTTEGCSYFLRCHLSLFPSFKQAMSLCRIYRSTVQRVTATQGYRQTGLLTQTTGGKQTIQKCTQYHTNPGDSCAPLTVPGVDSPSSYLE